MMMRSQVSGLDKARVQAEPAQAVDALGDQFYSSRQYKQALICFEIAGDELSNADSLRKIGVMHGRKEGVTLDTSNNEIAVRYLIKAMNLGCIAASRDLGLLYYHTADYYRAKQWLENSAETFDAEALLHLGHLYRDGHGVPVDVFQANYYYQKAFVYNHAEAEGCIYAINRVPHSKIIGLDAIKDDPVALFRLGQKSLNEDKLDVAMTCFELAIKLNYAEAYGFVGQLYYDSDNIKSNYALAEEYTNRAIELGSTIAINNLGHYHLTIKKDKAKANEYYELAIAKKCAIAFLNYGCMLIDEPDSDFETACDSFSAVAIHPSSENHVYKRAEARLLAHSKTNPLALIALLNYYFIINKSTAGLSTGLINTHAAIESSNLPECYKNYTVALASLSRGEYRQAINLFQDIQTNDQTLSAKISWHIAKAGFNTNENMTAVLMGYKSAYNQARHSLPLRRSILTDLEESEAIPDVLKMLVTLNHQEADINFKEGKKAIAKIYVEIAIKYAEKISEEFKNTNHDLLFLHAEILSSDKATQENAFNLYTQLAKENHPEAMLKLALIYYSGLYGKSFDAEKTLRLFDRLIPAEKITQAEPADEKTSEKEPVYQSNLIITNVIIEKLLIQYEITYFDRKYIYPLIFRILSHFGTKIESRKKSRLAQALCTSNEDKHRALAIEILNQSDHKKRQLKDKKDIRDLGIRYKNVNEEGCHALLICLAALITDDAKEFSKLKKALKNLSPNPEEKPIVSFLVCCMSDLGAAYYLPTLKEKFLASEPFVLILLALFQAMTRGGPQLVGVDDPRLIQVGQSMEKHIKAIMKFYTQMPEEFIEEMYANLKSEMQIFLKAKASPDDDNHPAEILKVKKQANTTELKDMSSNAQSVNGISINLFDQIYKDSFKRNGALFVDNNPKASVKKAICQDIARQILDLNPDQTAGDILSALEEATVNELEQNAKVGIVLSNDYSDFYNVIKSLLISNHSEITNGVH